MKALMAVAALTLSLAAQADPYVGIGGAAGDKAGGFAAVAGYRTAHLGVEGVYVKEQRNVVVDTSSGAGVSHQDTTVQSHGGGVAALGFAELAKYNGLPFELVGRVERVRLREGPADSWRTGVGTGFQYGQPGGLALRVLVDRAGEQTRGSVLLLKQF